MPKEQPKQLSAPNSDFYQLKDVLSADELALVKKLRTYTESKLTVGWQAQQAEIVLH
jgi:glutaryl-CoA dehydrogenase